MTSEELKNQLEMIINKYILDRDISKKLITKISTNNIKGILADIDIHKKKQYEQQDIAIIKNIYYYYC